MKAEIILNNGGGSGVSGEVVWEQTEIPSSVSSNTSYSLGDISKYTHVLVDVIFSKANQVHQYYVFPIQDSFTKTNIYSGTSSYWREYKVYSNNLTTGNHDNGSYNIPVKAIGLNLTGLLS